MGLFHPYYGDESVRLVGVEAAGEGLGSGHHAASLAAGKPGVLHGAMSYLLQDNAGQVIETHSISAGLDYPGVGPEHSFYKDSGRAEYVAVTDRQALEGLTLLCETEGIIPALESAHAVYYAAELAKTLPKDQIVLVCLSGRGDKDMEIVAQALRRSALRDSFGNAASKEHQADVKRIEREWAEVDDESAKQLDELS
jgi:tryptophan synthase beta chain